MNKKLLVLLVGYNLVQLSGAMIGPIYAIFVQKIGGDLLDASFAGSTYAIATGLAMVFFGRLEDKLKNKRLLMITGFLLTSATYFYFLFVGNVWQLLIGQILLGIGNAMYTPAHDTLYAKNIDKGKDGMEWGVWEAAYNFAVASGALAGGLIASKYGFDSLFIIMGLVCLCSGLYFVNPNKQKGNR